MARSSTALRAVGLLGAAALVITGCGGSDPAAAGGTTATPSQGGNQATVGDPAATGTGAPGQDLNGDGVPDTDPAAAGSDLGATATIPSLDGDEMSGTIDSSGSSSIFDARALTSEQIEQQDSSGESTSTTTTTTDTSADTVRYSGARISIDGVVSEVSRNGTFPSGSPAFRLLSVRSSSIEIELIAGEFTTGGGSGVLLDKGDEVSLVNASEQVTYRVTYLRPITSDTSGF